QKFPNHFHEFYVIGFIEGGKRQLWCKGKEYTLTAGDLVLFNPRDNHYCAPVGEESLDYRAANISVKAMQKAVKEITGRQYQPYFLQNVVYQSDITPFIGALYNAILTRAPKMEKEEAFFFMLERVLREYAVPFEEADIMEPDRQIKNLCRYMEEHFS
ncbi:MAG: AraC family ligand binding domain-containing protein, partial [Oscillospiraceae bacterium]|nr:AraC family ligand binding domain-containing protein [Oscillospiraceae bacterium]